MFCNDLFCNSYFQIFDFFKKSCLFFRFLHRSSSVLVSSEASHTLSHKPAVEWSHKFGLIMHNAPYTLHTTPCTLYYVYYTLHLVCRTLHLVYYSLYIAQCTLRNGFLHFQLKCKMPLLKTYFRFHMIYFESFAFCML